MNASPSKTYRIKSLRDGSVNLWTVLACGKTRLLKTFSTRAGAKAFARVHAGENGLSAFEVLA